MYILVIKNLLSLADTVMKTEKVSPLQLKIL